jgi:hypothetical protein
MEQEPKTAVLMPGVGERENHRGCSDSGSTEERVIGWRKEGRGQGSGALQ